MLSAIKELGSLVSLEALSVKKRKNGKVICIVIDKNLAFQDIEIEDFDVQKTARYLYKEGSSRGNNPAPIAQITDPIKTFNKKILKWLINCQGIPCISGKDLEIVKTIIKTLKTNKALIENGIKNKFNELSRKEKIFLTIKFEGDKRYLGDFSFFKDSVSYFEEKKIKSILARDKVCSLCGSLSKNVSGVIDVFKFYTIDKPGYIAGGFDKSSAWKNFPVCHDCKLFLEKGKEFLMSKLKFNFYGLNYFLIPKLLIGDRSLLKNIINVLANASSSISLASKRQAAIKSDGEEILNDLSQQKDILTLNFLFLQQQQSAERILLCIEDVFPSRINTILEAKRDVEKIFGEDFNFGRLRNFFIRSDESKKDRDLDKYFLEIIDAIFRGKKLSSSFLIKFYIRRIRKEFIKEEDRDSNTYLSLIKDAMMNIKFLEILKVINYEEAVMIDGSIFDQVFKSYSSSLSSPERRALILLGALTQLLLKKQQIDRGGNKPFMKKLKGLKMREREIKALLPQIQNKFEEYNAFDKGKRLIAEEASKYLLKAGDGWKMSVDEINFYFACGMNLCDEIASIAYNYTKKEA